MGIGQKEMASRFDHHPPDDSRVVLHQRVRDAARDFAEVVEAECPTGREQSLALTKIEEAMFWANAAVARNG